MTILSVLLILILTIYVAYKARNFMGRRFGDDDDKEERTSPFNAQADFEASLELSTKSEPIEEFNPIELNIEDETQITLLARNPYWLYTYWHIHQDTIEDFKFKYGEEGWDNCNLCVKLMNLTTQKEYLLFVNNFAVSWYIKVGDTQSKWKVYLGKMVPELGLVIFAESNIAVTPSAEPSSAIDPDWIPVDELWKKHLAKGYLTDLLVGLTGINSEALLRNRKDV